MQREGSERERDFRDSGEGDKEREKEGGAKRDGIQKNPRLQEFTTVLKHRKQDVRSYQDIEASFWIVHVNHR